MSLKMLLLLASIYIVPVFGHTKRGLLNGPSGYLDPKLSGPFLIEGPDKGYCLQVQSSTVKATVCNPNAKDQQWTFYMNKLLKNIASGTCLSAADSSFSTVTMKPCTPSNLNRWYCHQNTYSRPGLMIKSAKKCLRLRDDKTADMQPCNHNEMGQEFIIYGSPNHFVCTRDRDVGVRTKDPEYYLLKHEMFRLNWPQKYLKVFFVFNKDMYEKYKAIYETEEASLRAIRESALETVAILDKAYRQIKIRVLLTGLEIWKDGDKISVTDKYYVLKADFRKYSFNTLRKKYNFDSSVYIYGGRWDGAWGGAGMGNMCYGKNVQSEVFVMIQRYDTSALSFANILSHEFGHEFHIGHPMEPHNPCPNYRLYGSRCTMGGNDWPKGFSAQFLANIRRFKYSCLDTKPPQDQIYLCGNGVIDFGEECDCGTSKECITSNPCCDGSICKLKKGARCSSEKCCKDCQYDEEKSGCEGKISIVTAEGGQIEQPPGDRRIHVHWKLQAPQGKTIKLFFKMKNFEFREECPFDYIEVRDGGSRKSKLIGKYCRTPASIYVTSTSNEMFITFHADATYQSSFSLFHTVVSSNQGLKPFLLRHAGGKCVSFHKEKNWFRLTSKCSDLFVFSSTGHLQHVQSKKCVVPQGSWNGATISLTSDCTVPNSIFAPTSQHSMYHGLSGKCIHPKTGYRWPPENDRIVIYSGCNQDRLRFKVETQGIKPELSRSFIIKHFGGLCMSFNSNRGYFILTKSCNDKFAMQGKHLYHLDSKKCVRPRRNSNDNLIILASSCTNEDTQFQQTAAFSVKQLSTGKCFHPLYGKQHPKENRAVVIYDGCNQKRLQFKFIYS